MSEVSRRSMVGRIGAVVGLSGLGGLGGLSVLSSPAEAAPSSLTLHVTRLRILGPRQRAQAGITRTLRGVVHDSAEGPAIGEFFASSVVLAEARSIDPELGSFETQLFVLEDGSLTGSGTVHHDGTGAFTLTGGTGRYAGVHGAYSSRQAADHSASGQGRFTFEIGR